MPTIFSNLHQALFRQGIAKSLGHGYAQSLVAVTHPHNLNAQNRPSFARRHSTRFGRFQSLQQFQSAFSTDKTATNLSLDLRSERNLAKHGGLDAYFEHLQKKQAAGEDVEKEWTQFEFQRQIEWKPTPASVLTSDLGGHHELPTENKAVTQDGRASPTPSAVPTDAQAALAHIDAALEKELEARNFQQALEEALEESLRSGTPIDPVVLSRTLTPEAERSRSPANVARSVTPPTLARQSQAYADHLLKLAENGRWAEIPAVFEAMLVAGVRPAAGAYNALLMARIQLCADRNEIVTNIRDVYTHMLRQKTAPDSDTYNILVGLLASRSLEVAALKRDLEAKRVRFGGMDEPGKFMLASHEYDYAILSEDDPLAWAMKIFENSVSSYRAAYTAESYTQLITACARAGRPSDMLRLYEHMELNRVTPYAAIFPAMITSFAACGDLISAVECYDEYRSLAITHDSGEESIMDRLDSEVYAAVIGAYVICDKVEGAMKFYEKIVNEYGARAADIKDALISAGFVKAFVDRGIFQDALQWAQIIEAASDARVTAMNTVATGAADHGDKLTAIAAFANVPTDASQVATSAMALVALSVREGDVASAARYWHVLASPDMQVTPAFIEPTAMFAVAMIGSGQVAEGLAQSEAMFQRIRAASPDSGDWIEEGIEFINRYMVSRGITDPREMASQVSSVPQASFANSPFTPSATVSSFEDTFDPYAHTTDFKGSSMISDELEGSHGRKGPRLNEALTRFRNMRRTGRHPRYITYAKLISAAARENKMDLCHEILAMARTDVPLLPQYAIVCYGWSSILDAMVGACLTTGDRHMAEQFHQELFAMGSAPSANTFGLYITTLKESTKTFDEATEAVKIFHRAKAEGVEPSSFLYNALIGKLGKARRIDDCLFYFAEMRALDIKPTSVTYGTIVNALCRVSDEKFAEQLFDEMEAMPNYKARPAPYNSMMQFFLTTKRDKSKVLDYYGRMKARGISPTAHTYKLLVDTHATLEPVDLAAAESVLEEIRASGQKPEPVHYASLIHAKGCVLHDLEGARKVFDSVMRDHAVPAHSSLFQALFEAMVANHRVAETEPVLGLMRRRGIELTPYIANTLIHGWAAEKNIDRAYAIYNAVGMHKREPSTYEAMTRAFLATGEREKAKAIVGEMLSRGYPSAVVNKVLELLGGGGGGDDVIAMA